MHDWQNFIYIEPHAEDVYLYEEKELRLMNFKAFGGEVGLPPPRRGISVFPWLVFWASVQLEFAFVKWNNR